MIQRGVVIITFDEIVVWVIVGALAGSLAGMLVRRTKRGFGPLTNLGIGLVGALIGGSMFNLFNIDLGLGELAITFDDLLAAFIGSLIFLGGVWLMQRQLKVKS